MYQEVHFLKENNKKGLKIEEIENENIEETTKHGEFVSSYFVWLTPEKQKKRAKEIDNMTK